MSDKSVSLILPLYNEENTVEQTVSSVLDFFIEKGRIYEIIMVNDGSTDRTPAIIEKLSKNNEHMQAIHHATNRGYGAALTSGFNAARYETAVIMDADGQFDVSEIEKLLFYSEDYDIVAGYRAKRKDSRYRVLLGKTYTRLISLLFGTTLKDVNCGFKAFKRSMLNEINILSTGALLDAEIFIKAKKLGCSVKEVEVTHFPRQKGKQSGARFTVIVKAVFELWNLFVGMRLNKESSK